MSDRSRQVGAKAKRGTQRLKTRFARLDHDLLKSAAYGALTPASRSLLVELTMMVTDKNNGYLWLSVDDAAARLGVADPRAAMAALDQLQALGFIAMTRDAHFKVKVGSVSARARCWRLTWLPVLGLRGPSFDYRLREPPVGSSVPAERSARKRMTRRQNALKAYGYAIRKSDFPDEESITLGFNTAEQGGGPVEESSTAVGKGRQNSPFFETDESSAHIAVTMGSGAAPSSSECTGKAWWWAAEAIPHLDRWAKRLQAEIASDHVIVS